MPPDPDLAHSLPAALAAARKAKDKDRTLLLSTLLAAVKNRRIELRRDLTEADVIDVLRKGIKLRQDAAEQFAKASRPDRAERERAEIAIIESFLPPPIAPEAIRSAVRQAIAAGATELGPLMGQVMPSFEGRADGKLVNQIAREELQAR